MINEFLYEGKRATQWELSAHQIQGSSAIVKREKLTQLLIILKISAWPVLLPRHGTEGNEGNKEFGRGTGS